MENSPIQRGQNAVPNWGPPAKRAAVAPGSLQPAMDPLQEADDPVLHRTPEPSVPSAAPSLPPPAPWQQPIAGPPPNGKRPSAETRLGQIGHAPWWVTSTILIVSVLLELALRSRLNSVATMMAGGLLAALVISSPHRRQPTVVLALSVAVLGTAVAVLRASLWVTMPTLLMVGGCLILAGHDRLLRGGLPAVAARYLGDAALSFHWLLQPLRARPGGAIGLFGRRVLLAGLAVVPLALLLASADAVFGQLISSVGPGNSWQHALLALLILPFVTAVAIASRRPDNTGAVRPANTGGGSGRARSGGLSLSMTDATVVLTSVGLLLAAWGSTQAVVALGGADRLLATANLTAAENARQGFFQLVAATAFLVAIVTAADRFTVRASASDRRRFLVLTLLIGLETLGVVVATYARLALYISGFGNTMLRASVAWFLAWLAAVMLVVVVSVNRDHGQRWFGAVVFGLGAIWILAFGLWNPEAAVATGNVSRSEQAADIDYRYLGRALGPDAIPALVDLVPTLPTEHREQLTEDLCRQADSLGGGYPILSWNRSHAKADAALQSLGC